MIRTGKGNSGKNQNMVTLVSCEYAHWTLMAQVRPAPGNGGSTSWEIHRCYPNLELSGYLIWSISSIKLGSWSSWQKTSFHKIGSKWKCVINLLTSSFLLIGLFAFLDFNPCLQFRLTIWLYLHLWGMNNVLSQELQDPNFILLMVQIR